MSVAVCIQDPFFREAVAALLEQQGSLQVRVKAGDVTECLRLAKEMHARVLVVDSKVMSSQTADVLRGARLVGNLGTVALVHEGAEDFGPDLFDFSLGFPPNSEELFNAVRTLNRKTQPNEAAPRLRKTDAPGGLFKLTRREYEVAMLVSRGLNNRDIAEIIGLREQSIKNMVTIIMKKMACENRTQVALILTSMARVHA